jgi:hypothetical protein
MLGKNGDQMIAYWKKKGGDVCVQDLSAVPQTNDEQG